MKQIHDSEVLKEGQQVITACAFIYHSFNGVEKVFLPKRALTKKFLPGVFELPGGHIDFGEEIETGLKREIMEEFGMKVEIGDPFYVFTYKNEIKKSHSIEVVYLAKFSESINKIKINSEDHSEYGWFGENELDKVINERKGENDPEIKAIKKAFVLLKSGVRWKKP